MSSVLRPCQLAFGIWQFNLSLLNDEKFKTQIAAEKAEYFNTNEGSVSSWVIKLEAFMCSRIVVYASSKNKLRIKRVSVLNDKLKVLFH